MALDIIHYMPRYATLTRPSRWLCTTRRVVPHPGLRHRPACRSRPTRWPPCEYAEVYPIYNKDAKTTPGHENEYVEGADYDLIVGYRTEGDFPLYGNDDDRADDIAKWVVSTVMGQVKRLPVYRDAVPTQSILTITSNVEYGKATGAFPSGHKKGTPYAPGANPEGRIIHRMLPSMFSVGKIDYNDALTASR